jgi:hypothetical protein
MNENSCVGCKFLYGDGSGYSNYTWMETYVRCALGQNEALKGDEEQPTSWPLETSEDKWPPTMNGRCGRYSTGVYITLDPDREDHPSTNSSDQEQIEAICKAEGLPIL